MDTLKIVQLLLNVVDIITLIFAGVLLYKTFKSRKEGKPVFFSKYWVFITLFWAINDLINAVIYKMQGKSYVFFIVFAGVFLIMSMLNYRQWQKEKEVEKLLKQSKDE